MEKNLFDKALVFFGSQAEMARSLQVDSMRVYQWSRRGIPPKWALKIDEITDGSVSKHDLRPDIFGEKAA